MKQDIKVLLISDSIAIRKFIQSFIVSEKTITTDEVNFDINLILEKISTQNPDIVIIDVGNSIETARLFIKQIMDKSPRPIIILISSVNEKVADKEMQLLEEGALDYVPKPNSMSANFEIQKRELIEKIKSSANTNIATLKSLLGKVNFPQDQQPLPHIQGKIIVIGSSTGGPIALESILPKINSGFAYPILVAQHLLPKFTQTLSKRLKKMCNINVIQAADGEKIRPGVIYIAPGSANMTVMLDENEQPFLSVTENPGSTLSPSIDKLMESAASVFGSNTIGVVLTGMGKDSLEGAKKIKEKGGKILVQDQESSAVFGMGKEVVENGLASEIVPLEKMADRIREVANG
ncbi:MAG: hypothetical protein HYT08_04835 [Candidatus Levybacteria bacterium]|nr:hypothetical protein [Candidatus Levybacteria bacterium]